MHILIDSVIKIICVLVSSPYLFQMYNLCQWLSNSHFVFPIPQLDEQKEPYGPACRDYFWILCHLADGVSREDATCSWGTNQNEATGSSLDLNSLSEHVARCIRQRAYLERRHETAEDDGLIGLLNLATSLMKLDPPFRTTAEGQVVCVGILYWKYYADKDRSMLQHCQQFHIENKIFICNKYRFNDK